MYIQYLSSKSPTASSAFLRTSMKAPLTASTGPLSILGARYCASQPGALGRRPSPVK